MLCFSCADISRISCRVTRHEALFADKDYRQKLTDRALRLQGPTLPNTLPITDINSGLTDTTSYQRGSAIKRFNGIGGDGSFTSDKYPGISKPLTIDEQIVKKPMRSIPVLPPPPPRPKMLAMIKVRLKNGKVILRQDEINTVENAVKTKPVGSNIASDLKNRPGALAIRQSNAVARIAPTMLHAKNADRSAQSLRSAIVKSGSNSAALENSSRSLTTAATKGGGGKVAAIGLGLVAGAGGIGYLVNQRSKNMRRQPSQFSMSKFQADFERCANEPLAEFGRLGDASAAIKSGATGLRNAVGNVGKEIGNKAVAAKNKVAVLVKNANGKAFIQQRWKNVTDAGRGMGGFVKEQGGKATQQLEKAYAKNPNAVKTGAFVGGAVLGYGAVTGAKKLLMNGEKDKPKSQQLFPNG